VTPKTTKSKEKTKPPTPPQELIAKACATSMVER